MGIEPRPGGVNDDPFAGSDFPIHQFQNIVVLRLCFVRGAGILGNNEGVLLIFYQWVIHRLMAIRLIRVGGQQVQISRHDTVSNLRKLPDDALEFLFQPFIFLPHLVRHLDRQGDFFIIRQFLSHIRQG